MSIRVFKGSPNWKNGIPRGSKIRIEVLPAQLPVYTNDRVAKEVAVDLDPGYYHVGIKKFLGKNAMGRMSQIRWEERFFHDITPEEFQVLGSMQPTNCTARMTSDGPQYSCGNSGCDYYCNNPMAMVLHELEHKGISREDLLKQSDFLLEQNVEEVQEVVAKKQQKGPKIGRAMTSELA